MRVDVEVVEEGSVVEVVKEGDKVVDSDSEDGTYGGIFTSVNQNRVTRSGRRIVAPKHFMYDEESGILYTICITKSNNLAFYLMILSKQLEIPVRNDVI